MTMKRYDSYKPSGISWIGEIPSHWEAMRLSTHFHDKVNKNEEYKFTHAHKFNYGSLVPKNEVGDVSEFKETYIGYNILHKGDIVINGLNLNYDFVSQRVALSYEDCIITSAYLPISPYETTYSPFFAYLLKAMDSKKLLHGMGTGIRLTLSFNELKAQSIPIPPIDEQRKIVEFISNKTSQIDAQQREKERELRLLDELKQAEIANAVTRGLNPDVQMKKAQTLQFELIPVHWEERKIQYCFNERSQKGFPHEPMLCATQSQGVIPQYMYSNRVVVINKDFDKQKLVKVGDFVISLRSFEGGIEYAYYQGIISAAYTVLTPCEIANSEYYKYLFKSFNFIQLLQTCVTGIREGQNINYPYLSKHYIPIPPIEEQKAIVEYIQRKNKAIDEMIATLKAEIELLTEYKQRLIADAVTGQIKVD